MKTKQFFGFALLISGLALSATSCTPDNGDNPTPSSTSEVTVSFENQTLNSDNYWIGEENANGQSDGWGGMFYPCSYEEQGLTVNTNYCVTYWTGFAISARTETSFASPYSPDQYNNVAGGAHTGKNFLVAQYAYNNETITIGGASGAVVKSLWFTNSAYTVNSILNGDSYSGPKFNAEDWLKCTITGTHADGTTATVDLDLASNGSYVDTWQQAHLLSLGKVVSLAFSFSGSRTGDYGLNTPAYICIDDITIEREN